MAAPPKPTPAPPASTNGGASFCLGFVGAGNLAESIARGVAASGVLPASAIRTAPHRRPERGAAFADLGARILASNAQVVDESDVIVISVKPQIVKQVLVELKPLLSEEKLLVSIAAGIKMKDLQDWSGQRRIIRVMPNTPSAVGQAASVMCLGEMATENDENRVKSLFSAIGKVWTAEEKYFDAVTGLSGSGPAYIFLAIEAMADGGVAAGLPRDLALGLASQTDETWENGSRAIEKASGVHALLRVAEAGELASQDKAVWILERMFRLEAHRERYGGIAQALLIDLAQKGDPVLKPTIGKILAHLQLLQSQSSYF